MTTAPNAERIASEVLHRLELPHLVFWIQRDYAKRGQIFTRFIPAFSRYMFVDNVRVWEAVRTSSSLTGIVATCIDEAKVEKVVERCLTIDERLVLPPEIIPQKTYAHGERVEIIGDSAFHGLAATFDIPLSDGKVRLMIDLMGRIVPVDLDERDIDALPFEANQEITAQNVVHFRKKSRAGRRSKRGGKQRLAA